MLLVITNSNLQPTGGVVVYNFEVEGDHTYFVADGSADESWAWVHNNCADARVLRRNMLAAGYTEGKFAAHIVPTGGFSRRAPHVQDAITQSRGILDRAGIGLNSKHNGFFSELANHGGTHTDAFFLRMRRVLQKAERGGPDEVLRVLRSLVP